MKSLPKNQRERDEEIEWLTEYILIRSKEHGKLGKEVTFSAFLSEKKKFLQNALKKEGKDSALSKKRLTDLERDLRRDIGSLVAQNILLMGIKPHCATCGYANWYQVDEMKQRPECRGCRNSFDLGPETTWFYRLNSLVQDGVSQHGLIPVLLTLGELHDDARSSFIYSSSLDLYKRAGRGKYKHQGDLDIVCIQDGKFIMGEIKQSSSLFKQNDFDQALRLAKELKPNVLLFSSFDGVRRKLVEENIKNLKTKLNPLGIEVWWYQPTPIHYSYS